MANFGFTNPYMNAAGSPGTIFGKPATPPKPMTDRWLDYQNYTDFDQDMTKSPFVRDFLEPDLPQGVFGRYFLDRNNYNGVDRRAQFMQSQMGRAQRDYQNQLLSTPDLRFSDFLRGWGSPMDDWVNMSASQRGMNVPTRTQVIRWG